MAPARRVMSGSGPKTSKNKQSLDLQPLQLENPVLKETKALIEEIRALISQLGQSDNETPQEDLHKQLMVLLAQLRLFNFKCQRLVKAAKDDTTLGRQEVDNALLNVQNVKYRQRHLRDELDEKVNYRFKFDVDLVPLEQFIQDNPDCAGLKGHELFMARLKDEERRRLDLFVRRSRLKDQRSVLAKQVQSLRDDLNDTAAMEMQLKSFAKSMEPLRQYFYKH